VKSIIFRENQIVYWFGLGLGLWVRVRVRVTGFSVCTIFAILTSPHFGFSSFSFVIDIILSKLFQKVSGFVSFDTGFSIEWSQWKSQRPE
jgi:hypothetical protein